MVDEYDVSPVPVRHPGRPRQARLRLPQPTPGQCQHHVVVGQGERTRGPGRVKRLNYSIDSMIQYSISTIIVSHINQHFYILEAN